MCASPSVGLSVTQLAAESVALEVAARALKVRRPRLQDVPLNGLRGLAGMARYQLSLNTGERVVPTGTASLLIATRPVYASILAIALAGSTLIAESRDLRFGSAALCHGRRGDLPIRFSVRQASKRWR